MKWTKVCYDANECIFSTKLLTVHTAKISLLLQLFSAEVGVLLNPGIRWTHWCSSSSTFLCVITLAVWWKGDLFFNMLGEQKLFFSDFIDLCVIFQWNINGEHNTSSIVSSNRYFCCCMNRIFLCFKLNISWGEESVPILPPWMLYVTWSEPDASKC